MRNHNIPEVVVRRLPKYYRLLSALEREGIFRISSSVISKKLNITASQVRQDFSHFGAFGLQGYGYDVKFLREGIRNILGLTKEYNLCIVGAGHIGQALANYTGFKREGISVLAVFDIKKDGIVVPEDVEVLDISEFDDFVKVNHIDIVAITTQGTVAREIASKVTARKIPAIWNFSHVHLIDTEDTVVENINLNESIYTLIYMLNNFKED